MKEYEKITIKEVYPGIDWILYGSDEKGLKYDFIVRPGADAGQIRLLYKSLNELKLEKGVINLNCSFGNFTDNAPECLLEKSKSKINSSYILASKVKKRSAEISYFETEVGFKIDAYSKNETLIIDPLQHWWGTYFGGNDGTEGVFCYYRFYW